MTRSTKNATLRRINVIKEEINELGRYILDKSSFIEAYDIIQALTEVTYALKKLEENVIYNREL